MKRRITYKNLVGLKALAAKHFHTLYGHHCSVNDSTEHHQLPTANYAE